MKFKTQTLALALAALAGGSAQAALSVGSSAYTYGQTFDTLSTTGATNAWANDTTLAGWSLFNTAGTALTNYRADTGTSNTGSFYSYGAAGSSERALGGVASGSLSGYIAVAFSNDTGAALDGFTLNFNGEQWRNGGATSPNVSLAQSMVMEYGFGSSFGAVTWTPASTGFNWTSPVFGTTAAAAVDGNVAGLVSNVGGTVTTNWAAGDTLWVRWIEANDLGNDHALAIDDVRFSVVAAAVPEPGTYAMLLAGLACVGFIARRRKI